MPGLSALAERLGEPLCPEYGREYWFEHQRDHRLSMADLETIATEQVRRERDVAIGARRLVVCDTSPLTTLAYAKYYFGLVSDRLEETTAGTVRGPDHASGCRRSAGTSSTRGDCRTCSCPDPRTNASTRF